MFRNNLHIITGTIFGIVIIKIMCLNFAEKNDSDFGDLQYMLSY